MNQRDSICPVLTAALVASTGELDRSVTCSLTRCMAAVELDGRVYCGLAASQPGERQSYVDADGGPDGGEAVA